MFKNLTTAESCEDCKVSWIFAREVKEVVVFNATSNLLPPLYFFLNLESFKWDLL